MNKRFPLALALVILVASPLFAASMRLCMSWRFTESTRIRAASSRKPRACISRKRTTAILQLCPVMIFR